MLTVRQHPIASFCDARFIHVLNAGHFALDTAADEIAELVRGFVASSRSGFLARQAG
jgi:hypothetical protein